MAIVKISLDNTTSNVKSYICTEQDAVYSYPTDCGIGSLMDVRSSVTGKSVEFLIFNGVNWETTNPKLDITGITEYDEIPAVANKYVLDIKNNFVKNFTVRPLYDVAQVETAVIVGTITGDGNATVTVTGDNITGSPLAVSVAVETDDTATIVAEKMAVKLNSTSAISALYTASSNGANLVLTRKVPSLYITDAVLNIAYTNDTCTGLTPDATSDSTTAGSVAGKTFEVKNIPTRCKIEVEIMAVANPTLTFFSNITWVGASAPTLTAGKYYVLEFRTYNGGLTWYGNTEIAGL